MGAARPSGEVQQLAVLARKRRHRGIFAEDRRRIGKGERRAMVDPAGDIAHDPPIRPRLARRREQRALPADPPLGIGHRAFLLPPGKRRQADMGEAARIGVGDRVGDDHAGAAHQRLAHETGIGHGNRRIGGHHPKELHPPVMHRAEQVHRLQAGAGAQVRRLPEPGDVIPLRFGKTQMAGQHVGQPAHFAPAHGVWLAGNTERPRARPVDPARGEMEIDDRIALIRPPHGLVHALAEQGDHPRMRGDEIDQGFEIRPAHSPVRVERRRDTLRTGASTAAFGLRSTRTEVLPEALGHLATLCQEPGVQLAAPLHFVQQGIEKQGVSIWLDCDMQIRALSGFGAARIDHHQLRASRGPGLLDPLPHHRMAPCGVGADEQDQIRIVQIGIGARHRILAEGAGMRRHCAGHAKPGIGVDIAGADEALGQLVGDVVILGKELAGDVEGHAVRPMLRDRGAKPARHFTQRLVPGNAGIANHRMQQPPFQAHRFGKMRAFRTQPAAIGGMVRIPFYPQPAPFARFRPDAATHAAIRAGGANARHPLRRLAGSHADSALPRAAGISARHPPSAGSWARSLRPPPAPRPSSARYSSCGAGK